MLLDEEQQQQQQEEGVFLPAELQLSSVTTYPTELVGEAAHEAKFSPDGTLLVGTAACRNSANAAAAVHA